MAYFKINKTGCGENRGTVEIRYDCYLSRDDAGNEEHYVTVPDFENNPPYAGALGEMGVPVDMADYQNWVASLPTITRNNPFCCHFRQFPETVTEQEILEHGEQILDMALQNHSMKKLSKNWNPDIVKIDRDATYLVTKGFCEEMKAIGASGKTLDLGETKTEDVLAMHIEASVVADNQETKDLVVNYAVGIYPKIDACIAKATALIENVDFVAIAPETSRIRR